MMQCFITQFFFLGSGGWKKQVLGVLEAQSMNMCLRGPQKYKLTLSGL